MKVYVDDNDYIITYCGMTGRESLETSKTPIVVENISDYTKQVRKEVCEEIKQEVEKVIFAKDLNLFGYKTLCKILDQIQGETK